MHFMFTFFPTILDLMFMYSLLVDLSLFPFENIDFLEMDHVSLI